MTVVTRRCDGCHMFPLSLRTYYLSGRYDVNIFI